MDQNERVYIGAMTAEALGLQGAQGTAEQISISTPDIANSAIGTVDAACASFPSSGPIWVPIRTASRWPPRACHRRRKLQAAESRISRYRYGRGDGGLRQEPDPESGRGAMLARPIRALSR
jgi:flagellin